MKLRRVLLGVLVAFSALALAPLPPAYAGGPTSVLMVNPNLQRAQAAYHGDSTYAELAAGVGVDQTRPSEPPPDLATGGGEQVRLTWLIHDVQIWRIDRIHLISGAVWIETVVDHHGEGQVLERPASWHRAADAAVLLAALSAAGLLGDVGDAPTTPPGVEAEATVPAPRTPVPAALLAGLGGLALGAAGALAAVRARRRATGDRPPRVRLSG